MLTSIFMTSCSTLSMAPNDCIHFYIQEPCYSKPYSEWREMLEREGRLTEYSRLRSTVKSSLSSFKNENLPLPTFCVANLALSCIQLLFTHRLHLPYKMSRVQPFNYSYFRLYFSEHFGSANTATFWTQSAEYAL